jgi:Protein of unknown function (DUF3054)
LSDTALGNPAVGTVRVVVRAAVFDIAAVLVFVAVGRRSHDEGGNAVVEAAKVAAPFLIALAIAWLIGKAWRKPESLKIGVIVWAATLIDGMLLRRFVFDRGTAASFIIVATIALGMLLLGWRIAVGALRSRRSDVPT